MQWKQVFSSKNLVDGERIYRNNQLVAFKTENISSGKMYLATVRDMRTGEVCQSSVIFNPSGYLSSGICTCKSGRHGELCSHIAAVCYKAEASSPKQETKKLVSLKKKIVYPFHETNQNEYRYFDLESIFSDFVIYESDLRKAEEFRDDYYFQPRCYCDRNDSEVVVESDYYAAEITFDREHVLDTRCNCSSCNMSGVKKTAAGLVPCIHLINAMLGAKEYIKENKLDNTDANTSKVINYFKNQNILGVTMPNRKTDNRIRLVPRITVDHGEFELSFKIGIDKLYVVKSITKLVSEFESGSRYAISPSAELDFKFQKFDERGKAYYKYIRNLVSEIDHVNEAERDRVSLYNYSINDLKAHADLYGRRVDDFYDLFSRFGECDFINKDAGKKSEKLVIGESIPNITVDVERVVDSRGVFHGVNVSGDIPLILKSADSTYAFVNGRNDVKMVRLDDEMSGKLSSILDFSTSGKIKMSVGRSSLADFYRLVMPVLKKFAEVNEMDSEEVHKFLPPSAEYSFYIDYVDDVPSCNVKVKYGNNTHSPLDWLKSGFNAQPYRDEVGEKEVVRLVRDMFPIININADSFLCTESDETQIYELLKNGITTLEGIGDVYSTDAFKSVKVRPPVKLSMGVSVESDLLNLSINTTDLTSRELLDILASYRQKKRFHRLKSGDFVDIDSSFENLDDILTGMHITDKEFLKGNIKIPAYRALYLDKMLEENEQLYADRDRRFRKLIKEFKTVSDSDFDVPESLKSIVRPYQETGFKWLSTLSAYGFGGILADDMGLGKTLQMISVILADKQENPGNGTSIVVCPASLVYNWAAEFERFAPSLKLGILAGNKAERTEIIKNYKDYDVLITSYSLMGRDIAEYDGKSFNFQVIDEAQYIKNRAIGITKSVKLIKSRRKFALTGTPIENRLSELWSIFDFLMPGFLYKYEEFRKRFETPIMKNKDEDATSELRKMTSPFILRRLKKDVLKDLPDKIEETRYAHFSDVQQKLYDAQVTKLRGIIEGDDDAALSQEKIKILAEITRTREICCDPSLVFDNYDGESAKRTACIDLIKSAIEGEHRILLFTQFTSMMELLENDLKEEDIEYYKITGETPKKRRLALVDDFNSGETPVFLISLKAGGTGLNLTGADVVIHYDPWWNVAVQNQATDRAHRIGQTKVVTVYKLIASGTIEEKIENLHKTKQNLAEEILSGSSDSIGSMSREELLSLIEG